ncbi:hypothetical protein M9H77_12440 [Catharanthus roseus]|uniref:Uncharacterized protein n=1 Tax=Catharanthus roseus TaxID=4058 RepID=A0ACC0BHD1_CATRO|nr:hypothetical protein M9H77_12440 [Catharanthus roseus]
MERIRNDLIFLFSIVTFAGCPASTSRFCKIKQGSFEDEANRIKDTVHLPAEYFQSIPHFKHQLCFVLALIGLHSWLCMPRIQWGELESYDLETKRTLQGAHYALQFEMAKTNTIIRVDKTEEEYQDPPPANPPFIPPPMADYTRPSITWMQSSITRPSFYYEIVPLVENFFEATEHSCSSNNGLSNIVEKIEMKALSCCGKDNCTDWHPPEAALYCIHAISDFVPPIEVEIMPQRERGGASVDKLSINVMLVSLGTYGHWNPFVELARTSKRLMGVTIGAIWKRYSYMWKINKIFLLIHEILRPIGQILIVLDQNFMMDRHKPTFPTENYIAKCTIATNFATKLRPLAAMIEQKIGNITLAPSNMNQQVIFCDFSSGGHPNHECLAYVLPWSKWNLFKGTGKETTPTLILIAWVGGITPTFHEEDKDSRGNNNLQGFKVEVPLNLYLIMLHRRIHHLQNTTWRISLLNTSLLWMLGCKV